MAEILSQPPINPWWVTGLVDGEGCFYAALCYRSKPTCTGRAVDCVELDIRLEIALRADDLDAVSKLDRHFGSCGELGIRGEHQTPSARKHNISAKPQVYLRLRGIDVARGKIIPHFESFPLQTKKSRDFEIWKSIVDFTSTNLSGRKGWLRRFPGAVNELQEMCDHMKAQRSYEAGVALFGGSN